MRMSRNMQLWLFYVICQQGLKTFNDAISLNVQIYPGPQLSAHRIHIKSFEDYCENPSSCGHDTIDDFFMTHIDLLYLLSPENKNWCLQWCHNGCGLHDEKYTILSIFNTVSVKTNIRSVRDKDWKKNSLRQWCPAFFYNKSYLEIENSLESYWIMMLYFMTRVDPLVSFPTEVRQVPAGYFADWNKRTLCCNWLKMSY